MSFKLCSFCGKQWQTREEFLSDHQLRLEGYQWNYLKVMEGMPPEGILVFTHSAGNCGTSIALAARVFKRDFDNHLM